MPRTARIVHELLIAALCGGFVLGGSACAQGAKPQVDPEVVQIVRQAEELRKEHQSEQAGMLLQEALGRHPDAAQLHFLMGNVMLDIKSYQLAINEYQTAMKLQPPYFDAMLNIAAAYCNAGEPAQALPWYQRYIKENPTSPRIKAVEAQMLTAAASQCVQEKHEYDAKKMLEHAVQLNPLDDHAHFKLAQVCEELGDSKRAISEYHQVLSLQPAKTSAIFNIAGCYQSMGDTASAINWFQRYLQLNPNAPDAVTVQNMIAKLQEKSFEPKSDPNAFDFAEAVAEHGKFYRWLQNRLPLKVYVQPAQGVPGYRDAFGKALFESFAAWSQASQNRITFTQVPVPMMADITCSFTGNPYDVRQTGTDVEQGICRLRFVNPKQSNFIRIEHADLRILTVDRETGKPISDDDMKKTCLHELGHALGLHGHSTNNHDIMFFSVSPTVWPVLSKRDKATLMRIYDQYPPLMAAQ